LEVCLWKNYTKVGWSRGSSEVEGVMGLGSITRLYENGYVGKESSDNVVGVSPKIARNM